MKSLQYLLEFLLPVAVAVLFLKGRCAHGKCIAPGTLIPGTASIFMITVPAGRNTLLNR